MGTLEDPLFAGIRWNINGALQRPGAYLLGFTTSARHHTPGRHGDHSIYSLLCAKGFRPDADLQRRLCDGLSGGSSTMAAVVGVRGFSNAGDFDFGYWRSAARYPGEI